MKQLMKSRDVLPKNVPGVGWVGWGVSYRGGVGHIGVGWVMLGWGESCKGGVGHVGGGVGHVGVGWVWVM